MARALSRLALGRGGPRDLGVPARRPGRSAQAVAAPDRRGAEPLAAAAGGDRRGRAHGARLAAPALAAFAAALAAGLGAELPLHGPRRRLRRRRRRGPSSTRRARCSDDSRQVVAALEARLQAETGVPLKVRHNAVLGYFVEIGAGQGRAAAAARR